MHVLHRLQRTIARPDRILVFHHGELREEGRHEELIGPRGDLRAPLPPAVRVVGVRLLHPREEPGICSALRARRATPLTSRGLPP